MSLLSSRSVPKLRTVISPLADVSLSRCESSQSDIGFVARCRDLQVSLLSCIESVAPLAHVEWYFVEHPFACSQCRRIKAANTRRYFIDPRFQGIRRYRLVDEPQASAVLALMRSAVRTNQLARLRPSVI